MADGNEIAALFDGYANSEDLFNNFRSVPSFQNYLPGQFIFHLLIEGRYDEMGSLGHKQGRVVMGMQAGTSYPSYVNIGHGYSNDYYDDPSLYMGAWAVSTDAQVVPLPPSLLLMASGLIGCVGFKRWFRR